MDRNQKAREKLKAKTKAKAAPSINEKIAAIKNQACAWPSCKKAQLMTCSVPVCTMDEKGHHKMLENIMLGVPACNLHMHYLMSGLALLVAPNEQDLHKVRLEGQFEAIRAMEIISNTIQFDYEQKLLDAKHKRHHMKLLTTCPHCIRMVEHDPLLTPGVLSKCPGCKHLHDCIMEEMEFLPEQELDEEE